MGQLVRVRVRVRVLKLSSVNGVLSYRPNNRLGYDSKAVKHTSGIEVK